MLALASTTSLACTQSPKSISDTQAGLKDDGQLPTRGLQMPTGCIQHALLLVPGEKYGATQPDIEMLYPLARSETNDCVCRSAVPQSIPRLSQES